MKVTLSRMDGRKLAIFCYSNPNLYRLTLEQRRRSDDCMRAGHYNRDGAFRGFRELARIANDVWFVHCGVSFQPWQVDEAARLLRKWYEDDRAFSLLRGASA